MMINLILLVVLILIVNISCSDVKNTCIDDKCDSDKTYDELPSTWKDHMALVDILSNYYKQFSMCFSTSTISSLATSFKIVNLGVGNGYTSLSFATKFNRTNSHVWGIDMFLDNDTFRYDAYNDVINIQNNNILHNLSIIIGEWNSISRLWNYAIDILNIDGNSNYESMKLTFSSWSRFVKRDE